MVTARHLEVFFFAVGFALPNLSSFPLLFDHPFFVLLHPTFVFAFIVFFAVFALHSHSPSLPLSLAVIVLCFLPFVDYSFLTSFGLLALPFTLGLLLPGALRSCVLAVRATLSAPAHSVSVLATKHYLLSSLSPFAQRDWPSDPTVLAPKPHPLLLSPLTQRDLPSDPNLYKTYLCRVFSIKSTDVIDFTGHIDRTRFIAAGGSGEVWEASWLGSDKNRFIYAPSALPKVAVKLVRLPPIRDEVHKDKRFKMLQRELLVWSKLNHPHILPLVGIARIEGDANLPAFISPWMENGNVMDFLKQNPSFPASRFLTDIIKGLHYLHTSNPVIVHGDIKGANMLVNHRQEACLSDFGLSRLIVDNTLWRTTGTHANGTLRWMAPELIEGDMITPTIATDIYSFGVTCYEILSKGSPFAAAHDLAVMKKVTDGYRPAKIESCHSDEIWSIITQCWAHDPDDRPSTEETLTLVLQHNTPSNL